MALTIVLSTWGRGGWQWCTVWRQDQLLPASLPDGKGDLDGHDGGIRPRHQAAFRVEGAGYDLDLDWWRRTPAQQPAKVFGIHVDYDRGMLMVDEREPRPGFLRDWKKSQETVPAHYFKAVDEDGHAAYAGPFSTVERGLAHWRRQGVAAEEVPEAEVLAALGATRPMTRDEARRLGLRRFDGRPCP